MMENNYDEFEFVLQDAGWSLDEIERVWQLFLDEVRPGFGPASAEFQI